MAKLFSGCTPVIFFVLLALAAYIMPTSAPTLQTVYVRQATSTAFHLNSGLHYSVSFTPYFSGSRMYTANIIMTH